MELKWTKLIVAILFGFLRLFAGLLPIKIHSWLRLWVDQDGGEKLLNERRHRQVELCLSLVQSFGGGVLLATCLLHMFPEVGKSIREIHVAYGIHSNYPLAELLVCTGFFLLYFTEEFAHWMISRLPNKSSDSSSSSQFNKVHPYTGNGNLAPKAAFVEGSNPFDEEVDAHVAPPSEELKDPSIGGDKDRLSDSDVDAVATYKSNNASIEIASVGPENHIKGPTCVLEKTTDADKEENITGELQQFLESEVKTQQQVLRCVFIVLALSLHSIFEGLAIGLQNSVATIWYLFTAVSIHSFTILFCIGLELLLAHTRGWVIFGHILVLAIMSPVGIILGMLITLNSESDQAVKSNAVVFLEGLSSGTILYITFFEVLFREKTRKGNSIFRSLCLLGGFLFMALLEVIEI